MASLALNASTSITLPAGSTLFVYGTGVAVYGPGPQAGVQVGINNKGSVGPFSAYRVIYLTATGSALTYNTSASNTEEPVLRLSRSIAGDVQGVETLDNGQADGSAAMAAALGLRCPAVVANDPTAAAANDLAIQAALAAGGTISIFTEGVIWSNFGFTTYDDYTFVQGPKTIIKQVSGNSKMFAQNYWAQTGGSTPSGNITLGAFGTSARECIASIPFSALPAWATDSKLKYVHIKWDANGLFNGIYPVYNVDTVGKTIQFIYPKGASGAYVSSGTLSVAPANSGFTWDVMGVIDYNDDGGNGSSAATQNAHCFNFNHVRGRVRAMTVRNVNKYGMNIGNSVGFQIDGFDGNTGSDGIHLQGYNQQFVARGLRGTLGDDIFAWTYDDNFSGTTYNFETPTAGYDNLYGCDISFHVDAEPYARGVYIGTSTSATQNVGIAYDVRINGALVGGVGGKPSQFAGSATKGIVTNNASYTVQFDGCILDSCDIQGIAGQVVAGVSFQTTVNQLRIGGSRNVTFNANVANTVVYDVTLEGNRVYFDCSAGAGSGSVMIAASGGATIKRARNIACTVDGNGSNYAYNVIGFIGTAGTVERFESIGCSYSGYGQIYDVTLNAAPTISVKGGVMSARTVVGGQSATLIVDGVELTAGYLISPAWGNSKTVNLYANNLKITGGSIANWGGTGNTVNLYNGDGTFAIDATSSGFTPKSGAVFYNTAAGYGAGIGLYAYGAASATRIAA